jgi:hypothetical protein
MKIANSSVNSIQYREGKKFNTGAAIAGAVLFGLPGLLLAPKKKYAEISLNYITDVSTNNQNHAVIVIERDAGLEMRFQLEKVTGKTVELPEQKPEKSNSEATEASK